MGDVMMVEIDNAPVVGRADFLLLAEQFQWVEVEEIAAEPLLMLDGRNWLRSRPGRQFVRDSSGAVVAVLNRDPA